MSFMEYGNLTNLWINYFQEASTFLIRTGSDLDSSIKVN